MRRRKRKQKAEREAKGYLPGATWQDVMRNRPVTVDENARNQRDRGKGSPCLVKLKCRSCPTTDEVNKFALLHAASPRCPACGAIMDPVDPARR